MTDRRRIGCFGDSITRAGYPEILARLLDATVLNAGVGGQTTAKALPRLRRDVLDHQPHVAVILFGSNDSRLDAPHVMVSVDQYTANLTEMVNRCRESGCTPVLGTVPPIDEGAYFTRHEIAPFAAAGGLEAVLERYRDAARGVAQACRIPLVDLARILLATPEWLSEDGVHPSPRGNELLARAVADVILERI